MWWSNNTHTRIDTIIKHTLRFLYTRDYLQCALYNTRESYLLYTQYPSTHLLSHFSLSFEDFCVYLLPHTCFTRHKPQILRITRIFEQPVFIYFTVLFPRVYTWEALSTTICLHWYFVWLADHIFTHELLYNVHSQLVWNHVYAHVFETYVCDYAHLVLLLSNRFIDTVYSILSFR